MDRSEPPTPRPGASLPALVDAAYWLFDPPPPATLAVCTACCMPMAEQSAVLATPRRALTTAQMQAWLGAAAEHPFPRDVWAYLLPRLLDGLVRGEDLTPHALPLVLARYPTGDAAQWTAAQWACVDAIQRGLLRQSGRTGGASLDDMLCLFVRGGWTPGGLFAQVLAWPEADLVGKLANGWLAGPEPRIGISAFWPDSAVPRAFYTGPALAARIDAAVLSSEARVSDAALGLIDLLAASR